MTKEFPSMSAGRVSPDSGDTPRRQRKPPWLRVQFPGAGAYADVKKLLRRHGLATVCTEAACPNLGECWACGTLTVMILGEVCTRNCRFCNVRRDSAPLPPDPEEPGNVARVLAELKVKHAVLTSVTRDDLPDHGAAHWAAVIRAVAGVCPGVEVLVPDFGGDPDRIDRVLSAGPTVFSHNIETVRRLSAMIRPMADHDRSLGVLAHAALRGFAVKSGMMLGMGETEPEILEAMDELRMANVSRLTLGQYLAPGRTHLPVKRFLSPEEFDMLRTAALEKGFSAVMAGPLVRSSYHAREMAEPGHEKR